MDIVPDAFRNIRRKWQNKKDHPDLESYTAKEVQQEVAKLYLKSEIGELVDRISSRFKVAWPRLVEEYRKSGREISDKILKHVDKHELQMPTFQMMDKEEADEFLHKIGYDYQILPENVLLVLHLPKPVSLYWWKGGDLSPLQGKYEGVEWGAFYRSLLPVLWDEIDKENESGKLQYLRINELGHHSHNEFYYVWEVGPKNTSISGIN